MRKYRKVSKETLASLEVSQGKVFSKANCIHSSTSLEVHATSLNANSACDEVSQETCILAQGQHNGRDKSHHGASHKA